MVFSVDDEKSFEHLSMLKDLISSKHPSLPIVVVGNKTDKTRVLPMEEIEATVCMDWECGYVECSAKEKKNLEGFLRELARQESPLKLLLVLQDPGRLLRNDILKACLRDFSVERAAGTC